MSSFAKSAAKMGRQLETVTEEPKLRYGLEFYLEAFFDLDTERSHGMGWTRIPWSSIWQYGLTYAIDAEQQDDLVYLIQQMDLAHIKRLEENAEKKRKKR